MPPAFAGLLLQILKAKEFKKT
ncbi:hypothetical protein EGX28_02455 [Enterococcus avium]|nr:hypothetical protein EGX28_02455 [Enterococcus avium]